MEIRKITTQKYFLFFFKKLQNYFLVSIMVHIEVEILCEAKNKQPSGNLPPPRNSSCKGLPFPSEFQEASRGMAMYIYFLKSLPVSGNQTNSKHRYSGHRLSYRVVSENIHTLSK